MLGDADAGTVAILAELFPGAHEVVDALKARGLRLALVTNGEASLQRAKVDRFALAQSERERIMARSVSQKRSISASSL